MEWHDTSGMKRLRRAAGWFAVALALVLAAASTATAGPPAKSKPGKPPHGQAGSARGIVQSVAAKAIVLRELDGTMVRVPVAPSTHVFLNGQRATLSVAQPGLVALASWKAGKPATSLQIFDSSATVAVVRSVAAQSVVVSLPSGASDTIRIGPKTHVLLDGKPAQLRAVKPGYLLVLRGAASTSKRATELHFLRPG
jgi:hypothetical protein